MNEKFSMKRLGMSQCECIRPDHVLLIPFHRLFDFEESAIAFGAAED